LGKALREQGNGTHAEELLHKYSTTPNSNSWTPTGKLALNTSSGAVA
jgi:hypothetical protein